MFESSGLLEYSIEPHVGHKLIVSVDREIVRFVRALVPRYINLKPQRYPPHISVVRKQTPMNLDVWGRHQGKTVQFRYSSYVYNDEAYYWLRAWSDELIEIRRELGLDDYNWSSRAPDNFDSFHVTIGNTKT